MRTSAFAAAALLLCACPGVEISDSDADGYGLDIDCDDLNPAVFPGAGELCDGLDNDCDTAIDEGYDEDGDGYKTCGDLADCDDTSALARPGLPEVCGDDLDNDCDGEVDPDPPCGGDDDDAADDDDAVDDDDAADDDDATGTDGDEDGWTVEAGDCDDTNPFINPEAAEVCNGGDEDCDQLIDEDYDDDGDGVTVCGPDGNNNTPDDNDCNDNDPTAFPGAPETCDGDLENCLGTIDQDACTGDDNDNDGYTTTQGDCDDGNPNINPGAWEIPDGFDNDCNNGIDEGYEGGASAGLLTPRDDGPNLGRLGERQMASGDFNNDGIQDFVAASPLWDNARGRVDLYLGTPFSAAAPPSTLTPTTTITGITAGDYFGFSVDLSDVTGDGRDDILVGAPMIGAAGLPPGKAYVFNGQPSPAVSWTANQASFRFEGDFPTEQCGTSIVGVDLDGDNTDEVVIGCPWFNTNGAIRGRVVVFEGRAATTWMAASPLGSDSADQIITGGALDEFSGWALADLGDFTGDSRGDLIIGSPDHNSGRGRVCLRPGAINGGFTNTTMDSLVCWTGSPGEELGFFVGGGRNLGGDAKTDLLVGVPEFNGTTGHLTVVYGTANPVAGSIYTYRAFSILGDAAGDLAGTSGAIADLDGDGQNDLVMARPGKDVGIHGDAGVVDIIHGPFTTFSGSLAIGGVQDAYFAGQAQGDFLGGSVVAAGDHNADGGDDLILGAPFADFGGGNSGRIYFVPGFP